jgi:hypothetical protein
MTPTPDEDDRIAVIIIRPGSPAAEPSHIDPDVSLYQRILDTEYVDGVHARTESGEPITFYLGDTSAIDDAPANPVATRLWHGYNPGSTRETLYGTCIVMGANGDADADVPESVVRRFRRIAREVEVEGYVEQLREQGGEE